MVSRIWQAGFESGKYEADNWTAGVAVVSGTSYTGDWACRVTNGTESGHIVAELPNINQIQTGFFFLPGAVNDRPTICSIHTGSATPANKVFSLEAEAGGELQLYAPEGTLRDQNNFGYETSVWAHYGIDIKFDNSAGWIYIYKDGSLILSYDGDTGQLVTDNINFGTFSGAANNDWSTDVFYDDCYIDNATGEGSPTAPRVKRFYYVGPNANGNYSQWVGSDGNQVDNYLLVREQPANDDTTYVEAVTGSLVDSYGMTTFTLDANEDIIAMIPFAIAKRQNVTEQIALGTRSSGTDSVGSDQGLTLSYDTGYVWERQVTGSLGAPWNQSYMDSIEVMIQSAGTY